MRELSRGGTFGFAEHCMNRPKRMKSIPFDQAAEYFDRTRPIGARALAAVAEQAAREVKHRGKCLDVGIGTGRIGIALMDRGINLVGIDLSLPMLRQLRLKSARRSIPVAVADAVSLAFDNWTFGSAMACFVLNLIPDWRKAVTEMARVVRPGGVLLFMLAGAQGATREINDFYFAQAGDNGYPFGLADPRDLDEHAISIGLRRRILPPIEDHKWISVEKILQALEQGVYAGCWTLNPKTRERAANATRVWAARRFGDVNRTWLDVERIGWRAYDVPL